MDEDTCVVLNNTQEKQALEDRVDSLETDLVIAQGELEAAIYCINSMNKLIFRLSLRED